MSALRARFREHTENNGTAISIQTVGKCRIVPHIAFAILATISLPGCTTNVSGGGWSSKTYSNVCDSFMVPSEPPCLTLAAYEGEFKFEGQFLACRKSMENYTDALDDYFRCAENRLSELFANLTQQVLQTYDCYVLYFENREVGDPRSLCSLVNIPVFDNAHQVTGLEIDFGIPRCVEKSSNYNFAPRNVYQLEDCQNQVDIFIGNSITSRSSNATSARSQYSEYLQNLRIELNKQADDSIKKFNCITEQRQLCF